MVGGARGGTSTIDRLVKVDWIQHAATRAILWIIWVILSKVKSSRGIKDWE